MLIAMGNRPGIAANECNSALIGGCGFLPGSTDCRKNRILQSFSGSYMVFASYAQRDRYKKVEETYEGL